MPQPQFPYVPLYCTPGALYPHWSSWRRDGAKEMRLVKGDLIYEHDEIYTKPLASYQYLEPYLAGKDVGEMRCQLHDSWILFTGNEHIPTTGSENAISIIVGSGAAGMAQTVSTGGQDFQTVILNVIPLVVSIRPDVPSLTLTVELEALPRAVAQEWRGASHVVPWHLPSPAAQLRETFQIAPGVHMAAGVVFDEYILARQYFAAQSTYDATAASIVGTDDGAQAKMTIGEEEEERNGGRRKEMVPLSPVIEETESEIGSDESGQILVEDEQSMMSFIEIINENVDKIMDGEETIEVSVNIKKMMNVEGVNVRVANYAVQALSRRNVRGELQASMPQRRNAEQHLRDVLGKTTKTPTKATSAGFWETFISGFNGDIVGGRRNA